jgi:dynein heavy chain
MSASGVVHIQPGQPSQFTPLGQWWRRSSLFNTLRSIPFFKNFLPAKTYQLWNQNVRFRKYSQVRARLIKKLFLAKRAFCSTLLELNRQCFELRSTPLLTYTTKHSYSIEEFIETQNKVRTESYKVFESIVDKVQALLEKVCEDVTSRVRASEDGLPPGGLEEAAATTSHKSQKSKSMQQMKQEALERARLVSECNCVCVCLYVCHVCSVVCACISVFIRAHSGTPFMYPMMLVHGLLLCGLE